MARARGVWVASVLCALLGCSSNSGKSGRTARDGGAGTGARDGGAGTGSRDGGAGTGSRDGGAGNGADAASGSGDAGNAAGDAGGGNGGWWKPVKGLSWQWQLTGTIDSSFEVAMYDVDLFETPQATIDKLHADGRIVICYTSVGTREVGRPDTARIAKADYGEVLPEWPDENWLDVRSKNVRAIMLDRLDLAASKHCDGIEPDNLDGYASDTGFDFKAAEEVEYVRFLAAEAHARGLSIGLKNALDLIAELEPHVDWALNEECLSYDECALLKPFLDANKPVFHVEYVDALNQAAAKREQVCKDSSIAGFSTLVKTWDLGSEWLACD